MSDESRARHLARVGRVADVPTPKVCPDCLREVVRGRLYAVESVLLDLYLEIRDGEGSCHGLGELDHEAAMGFIESFIRPLRSAGDYYHRMVSIEYDEGRWDELDQAMRDEVMAFIEQRERWLAEPRT